MLELYEADWRVRGARGIPRGGAARRSRRGRVPRLRPGEPLRREPWPAPPEPCPLPLLAAARSDLVRASAQSGSAFRLGEWEATWAPEDYAAAVDEVRAAIARGDVYQVNLVQHLSAPFEGDPARSPRRSRRSRPLHPRPLAGDGWAIVSASPELFLARRGDRLVTMPIKGTRPLGEDVDDAKDAAEHVMIVDLERNDLSRVCESRVDPLARVDGAARARRRDASRLDRRGPPARRASASRRSCARRSPAARSPARRRSPRSTTSRGSSRSAAARRWARSGRSSRTATSSSR